MGPLEKPNNSRICGLYLHLFAFCLNEEHEDKIKEAHLVFDVHLFMSLSPTYLNFYGSQFHSIVKKIGGKCGKMTSLIISIEGELLKKNVVFFEGFRMYYFT